MDEVARAAGCSRTTLYSHFRNMEDVYGSLLEQEILRALIDVSSASCFVVVRPNKVGVHESPRQLSSWQMIDEQSIGATAGRKSTVLANCRGQNRFYSDGDGLPGKRLLCEPHLTLGALVNPPLY